MRHPSGGPPAVDRAAHTVRGMISRGKVISAEVSARTVLQNSGLDGETLNGVELLLPPGYSANPVAGVDLLHLQVLGWPALTVAVGGDNIAGDAIADLAPGEFGLRHAASGQMIVMRNGYIEIVTPTYVKITAAEYVEVDTPLLKVSGDILDNYATNTETMAQQRAVFNGHDHIVANVQPGTGTLTTGVPVQQED